VELGDVVEDVEGGECVADVGLGDDGEGGYVGAVGAPDEVVDDGFEGVEECGEVLLGWGWGPCVRWDGP
jgi:hypothetical protein